MKIAAVQLLVFGLLLLLLCAWPLDARGSTGGRRSGGGHAATGGHRTKSHGWSSASARNKKGSSGFVASIFGSKPRAEVKKTRA